MNETTATATQPTCENPWDGGCKTPATREGLLQVANPSAEHPEGVQRKVKVCDRHSYTWSALWGTWPLKKDVTADASPADLPNVTKVHELRTGDLAEATDAAQHVRDAWQAKLDDEGESDSFPYEQQETSYALDALAEAEYEWDPANAELEWEFTYPNGDRLRLTVVRETA